MKTYTWCSILALTGLLLTGCNKPPGVTADGTMNAKTSTVALETQAAKVAYSIGHNIGTNIKKDIPDIQIDPLIAGMLDGTNGNSRITEEEKQKTLKAFSTKMRENQQKERDVTAKKNMADGQAYLAKNKTLPGVKVLKSGVQYKVLKSGTGKRTPKATDKVVVHYEGRLINGDVFDSSLQRKTPATFGVNQVIKGWTEILQKMKKGDKWQVTIPSELAYGERGAGGKIGPNATLVFDVELMDIQAEKPAKKKPVKKAAKKAGKKG